MKGISTTILIISVHFLSAQGIGIAKANIKNIDIDYFSEYAIFDSIFDNKRIVFLGEPDHGDQSAIKSKTRIIKYLTTSLGFKSLIIEKGIYETFQVGELIKERDDKDDVLKFALSGTEYDNQCYLELRKMLSQRTFEFAGLDINYATWISKSLKSYLIRETGKKKISKEYYNILNDLNHLNAHFHFDPTCPGVSVNSKRFKELTDLLIGTLINREVTKTQQTITQVLRSNLGLLDWVTTRGYFPKTQDGDSIARFWQRRDKYMADNLVWYLNNAFKDKKVIVSTSTFHMSRNILSELTMADYLPDSIIRESYFLPFLRFEGVTGYDRDINPDIDTVKSDTFSIEYALHSSNIKSAIIDFKQLDSDELDFINNLRMHPSGSLSNTGKWTEIYNGIFFTNETSPCKFRPYTLKETMYYYDKIE